ncbi:hypothetical protein Enr13x_30060 [Stieleria neptunia]|uniref:SHD domain-containing protein n=1 Tax=Stieleria neptunia TaxID=2527979 RepID=A0A518HQN1_9BACT|nr:FkbM family methyltransferase [Stieleria neptunia]QDV43152.1 hypothetical protein Enr13x_30060 [Stieleria neptunia]
MKNTLRQLAKRTPFYSAYQRYRQEQLRLTTIKQLKSWDAEDEQRKAFYSNFVQPGSIVFDVGANLGNRAKVFLALGAKTIGVEPQPYCQEVLRQGLANKDGFHLESCALGTEPGEAEMFVSSAHTISSMSKEWIQDVKESGRFAEHNWDQTIRVPVKTMDDMIDQYGTPAFVKVDVEGFELAVVSGLSKPVGAISLEFVPEHLENTLQCVDRLAAIAPTKFRYSLWDNMEWGMEDWVGADQIKHILTQLDNDKWGDLFARTTA